MTRVQKFMNLDSLYAKLTIETDAKLAFVVLDGLGDIATREQNYLTPLEAAKTPNLDTLAKDGAQGRMMPVGPGITPGSGPGHLGLFGYDPREFLHGELPRHRHRSPRRTHRYQGHRGAVRVALQENKKSGRCGNYHQAGKGPSVRRCFSRPWFGRPLDGCRPESRRFSGASV